MVRDAAADALFGIVEPPGAGEETRSGAPERLDVEDDALDRASEDAPRRPRRLGGVALRCENLRTTAGGIAPLDGLDLVVEPGEPRALLGAPGSGKSALLRAIAGLERLEEGKILSGARDITDAPPVKRSVALVPSRAVAYPRLDVYANIAAPLRRSGLDGETIDRRTREAAKRLGLDGALGRRPHELDDARRQRLAIAKALAKSAEIVLLDDPLAALEPAARRRLLDELPVIFAAHRVVVLYAASDPEEALALGGRTSVVEAGRIVQTGPALEVYRQPSSLAAARATSDPPINAIDARVAVGRAWIGRGEDEVMFDLAGPLRALADNRYVLGLRPHHLQLVAVEASLLRARVERIEARGSTIAVHLSRSRERWVATIDGAAAPPEVGEHRGLIFDPARLYAFYDTGALAAGPEHG